MAADLRAKEIICLRLAVFTIGSLLCGLGLLGITTMHYNTPCCTLLVLAIWMFINSFGSGLFQALNTSAIMLSVSPQRRGIASSMRAFFNLI